MSVRLLDLLLDEKKMQLKGGLYHKTQMGTGEWIGIGNSFWQGVWK